MAGGLRLPPAPQDLTGDDIIRAGACAGGVARRLVRLAGKVAAAEPASRLLTLVPEDERQHVLDAINLTTDPSDEATSSYGDGDGGMSEGAYA